MPTPTFTPPPTAPARSDAPATFVTRADAFVAWFATLYTELVALVVWLGAQVATITAYVTNVGFTATSTTSMAIGLGSKSFTIATGLGFVPGMFIVIADTSAPSTSYMLAQVTSYDAGTGAMVANAYGGAGSGTLTAWTIAITGPGREVNAPVTASVSGSYTPNFAPASGFATAVNFVWTLTGNLTLNVPTGMTDGQSGVIYLIQDGTGGRTLSLNASIKKPGGAVPTLSTTAGAIDRVGYFVRGSVLELTALEKAFA